MSPVNGTIFMLVVMAGALFTFGCEYAEVDYPATALFGLAALFGLGSIVYAIRAGR